MNHYNIVHTSQKQLDSGRTGTDLSESSSQSIFSNSMLIPVFCILYLYPISRFMSLRKKSDPYCGKCKFLPLISMEIRIEQPKF